MEEVVVCDSPVPVCLVHSKDTSWLFAPMWYMSSWSKRVVVDGEEDGVEDDDVM